jgi:2-amino-4-hydroxy-6-hydroxymethyldihydropteridine diphosphokinase
MAILKKKGQDLTLKQQYHSVTLLLGGNLGNVQQNFSYAKEKLKEVGDVFSQSSVYQTEAWGMENEPDFLNQVIRLYTELTAKELLHFVLNVEKELGRERVFKEEGKYISRLIDIDILFFDNMVLNEKDLIIPHPRMSEREFVLEPLSEIMGNYIHPILLKSIDEIKSELQETLRVVKLL